MPFERIYDQALALHRAGRLAEADALYAQALVLKPDLVEAHNNRGAIRQMAGDWDGALACYDGALRLRPDYVEALANRGNCLIHRHGDAGRTRGRHGRRGWGRGDCRWRARRLRLRPGDNDHRRQTEDRCQ